VRGRTDEEGNSKRISPKNPQLGMVVVSWWDTLYTTVLVF